jgi:hypothetical protein
MSLYEIIPEVACNSLTNLSDKLSAGRSEHDTKSKIKFMLLHEKIEKKITKILNWYSASKTNK